MGSNIVEVARRANVSTATAARAFSNPDLLAPKTRTRVLQAAEQLDYVPNLLARSLRNGKTNTFAVLTTDLQQRLNTLKLDNLQQEIRRRGYHTLLLRYDGEEKVLAQCGKMIDGLVLCCLEDALSPRTIRALRDAPVPVVSLEPCAGLSIDVVTADRAFGSYLAVEHLRRLGHTKIGLAQVALRSEVFSRRTHGYQTAMCEAGLEPVVLTSPGRDCSLFEEGYLLMREATSRGLNATAWIFSDDEMAVGGMRFLEDRGLRVPEEVAVIGWDDSPICDYLRPRLTSVTQPVRETVTLLVDRLLSRLGDTSAPAEVTMIRPELVVRESCGNGSPPVLR